MGWECGRLGLEPHVPGSDGIRARPSRHPLQLPAGEVVLAAHVASCIAMFLLHLVSISQPAFIFLHVLGSFRRRDKLSPHLKVSMMRTLSSHPLVSYHPGRRLLRTALPQMPPSFPGISIPRPQSPHLEPISACVMGVCVPLGGSRGSLSYCHLHSRP